VGRPPPAGRVTGDQLLAIARDAARAGAAELTARYGRARGVQTKSSPTDMVSEADKAAERAILAVLRERAPEDAIVGEEGADVPGTTGRRWIVDPLDGTTNFLFGYPQWCVSIACEGLAGVVYDPSRDELFEAQAGGPLLLDGQPLPPSRRPPPASLATALVATGFGYSAEQRALQAAVVSRVLPLVRDLRRGGSAATDLAWTAAGRCDAYWERGVQPWDVAAGKVLAASAGLVVRDLPPAGGLPAGLLVAPASIADALTRLVA
jgi:myo-inositol-1(or 4)-monophosphatase